MQKNNHQQTQSAKVGDKETQILAAIRQKQTELKAGGCEIDELADHEKHILIGDLNQDGINDFIYGYALINNCGGQATSTNYAVFLNKNNQYVLDSIYHAGLSEFNALELDKIIQNGVIIGRAFGNDEKYLYRDKDFIKVIDPNQKLNTSLAKAIKIEKSPFSIQITQALPLFTQQNVECGGFFDDDQPEKRVLVDRYILSFTQDEVALLGVTKLTSQDIVDVEDKRLVAGMTTQQVRDLFQTGSQIEVVQREKKLPDDSDDFSVRDYDSYLRVYKEQSDDAYLFYFKNNKLIAIQYFIPC
ncbi:hypothetical protein [Acinetobacter stercoris]|uniref:Uncharacterized protein n=1 Tax=Acinetobacter stercoris TaxID=2126983 RepID=A0A2U3N081_9GAMM|nr:hypothetical protein [Acinetobacter stercoris]SPL71033.1 hypothetical protein KPC_2211 [Acinetobacter stercoris]